MDWPLRSSSREGPSCVVASYNQTQAGNGRTWRPPVSVGSPVNVNGLNALSCASASFCAGLFANSVGLSSVGFYDGTDWSDQSDRALSDQLAAISCPTVKFCAVIDVSGYVSFGTRP